MNEAEWLATDDVAAMLDALRGGTAVTPSGIPYYSSGVAAVSARKLRLFACACADLVSNDRTAYGEEGERLDDPLRVALAWARPEVPIPAPLRAALLRDICGDPWRPAPRCGLGCADPEEGYHADDCPAGDLRRWLAWRDGTVPRLARRIHDDRAFDLMPVLADALEDAGCTDEAVLEHCRGSERHPSETGVWYHRRVGQHARGCWVLDLLLNQE